MISLHYHIPLRKSADCFFKDLLANKIKASGSDTIIKITTATIGTPITIGAETINNRLFKFKHEYSSNLFL